MKFLKFLVKATLAVSFGYFLASLMFISAAAAVMADAE